jgi:hypothetical protein
MLQWAAALALLLGAGCVSPRAVQLDTGSGALLKHVPPNANASVQVGANAFEHALHQLVLEMPLTLSPPAPGWLVRTSTSDATANTRLQQLVSKSFGGVCKAGQRRSDCLSLLDDALGLTQWDKLGIALGLSFRPMRQSIAQAVEDTLAPQLFYSIIATGLVTWVVLAANPEPVFTKTAAIVSALMLIYLGVETFLAVVKASLELKRTTDRATTFAELEDASEHFGRAVGPQVAQVVVLAVTVVVSQGMVGGSALMASRMSMLPHFAEAAALGSSQLGVSLANVGQVSAVAVVEGNVVITLAPTAVAMAAQGEGGGAQGFRVFKSFESFKRAMGPAGPKKQWHHVVEQTESNIERFGAEAIHNTENVLPLEEAAHKEISRLFSQIRVDITGSETLTVRKWLSTQSLEAQRQFGLRAIESVSQGLWP